MVVVVPVTFKFPEIVVAAAMFKVLLDDPRVIVPVLASLPRFSAVVPWMVVVALEMLVVPADPVALMFWKLAMFKVPAPPDVSVMLAPETPTEDDPELVREIPPDPALTVNEDDPVLALTVVFPVDAKTRAFPAVTVKLAPRVLMFLVSVVVASWMIMSLSHHNCPDP